MLDNLPPVNHQHVEALILKHSLPTLISLVSRIIVIRSTQNLRNYLGIDLEWLHTSKHAQTTFSVSNLPPKLQKFSFLFLARTSNHLYPKRNKNFRTSFQNGVHLVVTRYSSDALNRIFGSTKIPYLDNRHTSFLYKLWLYAHVRYLPDQNTTFASECVSLHNGEHLPALLQT